MFKLDFNSFKTELKNKYRQILKYAAVSNGNPLTLLVAILV
jgi:hypothetical protein